MKVIESLWGKIIGGISVMLFSTVLGSIVGTKVAQARNREKIEGIDKKFDALEELIDTKFTMMSNKISSLEKANESQALSMGREIGELKTELKTMRRDIYEPKFEK